MAIVRFKFEDKEIPTQEVKAMVGDNILDLAEDNGMHVNSNCGMVCACSTCHVYIETGEEVLTEISDQEEDFIDRAINPRIESRLSCQCNLVVDKEDLIIEVRVPDQSGIIGHEH
ncbi:MAG: Ferredoxin, 2Fe-2S [uncultured Aureispira sp.]|uniref:Ferredoxin, 2Fe-2S n=1 Tax=uncultured Aureispira sp. TaxID=1331704 RepID=A0A6S6T9T7_9BACT|nr:MAG: Ferredoxin, 2Fe-2S [uncultured Aureispira sp.]